MNSSFAIIAGGCPWPRSRHCSASGPDANRHIMSRYAVQQTFLSLTTTYWELLKQPDKQKLTKLACSSASDGRARRTRRLKWVEGCNAGVVCFQRCPGHVKMRLDANQEWLAQACVSISF